MEVTQRLAELRERAGYRSKSAFAKALGYKTPSGYQRYEDPALLQSEVIPANLARDIIPIVVGRGTPPITEAEVLELAGLGEEAVQPRIRGNANSLGPLQFPEQTIPVYGQAIGGQDGRFVFNGNRIADVLCPPSLAGVRDAYAVYIVGDSMEPRYIAGEVAYVHPRLPVRQGDFVVAQIKSDIEEAPHGFIKRFVSFGEKLVLEQLNPQKKLQFKRDDVVSVHQIVMAGRS